MHETTCIRSLSASDVRIKAYDVLLEWLAVIGSGLDVNVTERLIQQMLDDVRPQLDNESDKVRLFYCVGCLVSPAIFQVSASIENEDSSLSRKVVHLCSPSFSYRFYRRERERDGKRSFRRFQTQVSEVGGGEATLHGLPPCRQTH